MNSHDELKVLLIEDDEDDYVLIKTLLSEAVPGRVKLDWEELYEGGLNALSNLDYDAILLDYALGDRTGLELLYEAKEKLPRSAHSSNWSRRKRNRSEGLSAGAADYLVKDEITATTLQRSIRYAIERKKAAIELNATRTTWRNLLNRGPPDSWR